MYIWNYRSSVSRQAQAGGKRSLKIVVFFLKLIVCVQESGYFLRCIERNKSSERYIL